MKKYLQLPNILTLVRLLVAPLVLPLLFYSLLPFNTLSINCFLAVLFALFNLTDFFDGYLARKYQLESRLGAILDPLADKFLLVSAMITLVALNKLFFYWAIIFISRDFFVMGLRVVGADAGFQVPVSSLAKVKTVSIMIYLTMVIIRTPDLWKMSSYVVYGESAVLIIALALTIVSAVNYGKYFINHYTRMSKI